MIVIQNNNSRYTIDGMMADEWLYERKIITDEDGNPVEVVRDKPLPDGVKFIIDDDHPLAAKILANPYFEPVTDGDSNLIDITPLEPPPPPLDNAKQSAIAQTKAWVASELDKGMEYNGNTYSVTLEKQNLLSAQLAIYMANIQADLPASLSWNASGQPCRKWEYDDLLMLANAIHNHVAPIVAKQQYAEIKINEAGTYDEIQTILQDFI